MSDSLPLSVGKIGLDAAMLQGHCQQLAHLGGASLPTRWPGDEQEVTHLLTTLLDQVTRQMARQRARNEARKQVEEELRMVERLKTQFIQNVSHELRTPLASIEGFAMALQRGLQPRGSDYPEEMSPETRQQFLGIISREARRLGELIEDVLEITEIEAQPVNTNQVFFTARDVFSEAVMNFKKKWGEDKGQLIRFRLDPAPEGPQLFANREAMREILRHLLDNAHKFSDGQEILLGAESARPDPDILFKQTRVWVRDQGIGIPASEHARVFSRFHRVDTTAHSMPGTGLGLYIVQCLARQNRGRVTLASEVGKGTTFSIFLPAEQPPPLLDPNVSGLRPG